ncbi:MAG: VWA domain-containing protein [Acidobacteria bacterium]|nr:VWA domain-containing protein [Acidobacteriota bacterium]MBV9479073.1 VWA domain-containing protein [Acidobacteriota bacterium]
MRKKIISVSTALLLTAVTLPVQPQATRSDASIQVNLVELPVTVTSTNGDPVRGLTKENFEIYDQGRKQDITNFEMIDFADSAQQQPSAATAEAARPAAARNFLLLFDLGNSSPTALVRARSAASDFVNKQVLPHDRVAVATIAPQQGFQLHANFSTDRKLATSAIDTLGLPQLQQTGDPLLVTMKELGVTDIVPAVGANQKEAVALETLQGISLASRRANDAAQREYVDRQLHEFASMGAMLDRVPGRKQVILLSEGFDPKVLQGHGNAPSEETRAEQDASERGEIWNINSEARFGSSSSRSNLGAMVDSLRRSDVVLNAIDIQGLRGGTDAKSIGTSQATSNDSLFLLTNDTGGTVFRNTNNLAGNFSQLLRTQEVTYLLAFNGASTKPGTFHNLKVKLVNAPKARVNYRVGYYEPHPIASDMDRLLSAGEIMMNSIPVADVKMHVLATPIPAADKAEVPVVVETEGSSLLANVTTPSVAEEFYVYAFDPKGTIVDFAHQRMNLDLAKVRDRIAANGVKLFSTLDLPPGDYDLRVLVIAAGTRNSFQSVPLHVPAATDAYATAAIADPQPWLMVRAVDKNPNRAYPFAFGEKVLVPAARASLANGPHDLAVVTHGFGADPVRVDAHVEDANGKQSAAALSLVGRTSADEAGNVKLLFSFAPDLPHGDYALVMTLHGDARPDEAHVRLPFSVE